MESCTWFVRQHVRVGLSLGMFTQLIFFSLFTSRWHVCANQTHQEWVSAVKVFPAATSSSDSRRTTSMYDFQCQQLPVKNHVNNLLIRGTHSHIIACSYTHIEFVPIGWIIMLHKLYYYYIIIWIFTNNSINSKHRFFEKLFWCDCMKSNLA